MSNAIKSTPLIDYFSLFNVSQSHSKTSVIVLKLDLTIISRDNLSSLFFSLLVNKHYCYSFTNAKLKIGSCREGAIKPWTGEVFPCRGLFTFKKKTVMEIGGFASGLGLQDPVAVMAYELMNANTKIERVDEYLYISRISRMSERTRGPKAVEWRKKLIETNWPDRVEADE